MMEQMPPEAALVLDFWFGAPGSVERGQERTLWWDQTAEVDQQVRLQFAALHARAMAGDLEPWRVAPLGSLAYVLVLDQFSRHLYRADPRAYAGDPRALVGARDALTRGWDLELPAIQRQFLYMPFMHSERLDDQERSAALFDELARVAPEVDQRRWAQEYLEIIRRVGRFPHRDAVLCR
jgi:uncharacterized protein (DUF924 family)